MVNNAQNNSNMNNMNINQNNMYNNNMNLNNQGNIGINNNQNQNFNNYQGNNQGNTIQNNINNIQNNINNNNINQINSQFNNNINPNNNIMNNNINQNQNACNMDISNIENKIQQNNAEQSGFNKNNNTFQNKDNNIVYNDQMNQHKNKLIPNMHKSTGQLSSSKKLGKEKFESKLSSSDGGIKNRPLNKHIPKQIDETIYFKEESKNQIVDRNEMNIIRNIIEILYSSCNDQSSYILSELICNEIKKKLGGEWFVLAQGQNDKLSFNISSVSNTNIIKIKIGESRIQIGKLK